MDLEKALRALKLFQASWEEYIAESLIDSMTFCVPCTAYYESKEMLMLKNLTLSLLAILTFSASALAETFNSSFGFGIDVPSQWLIWSSQEIRNSHERFNEAFENNFFKNADKAFLEEVRNKILTGQCEIIFCQNTPGLDAKDNINIIEVRGYLPTSIKDSKELCDIYSAYISNLLGVPIKVSAVGLTKTAGLNALHLDYIGVAANTRCIEHQIQKSEDVIIVLTGTCSNQNYEAFKKYFADIIATFSLSHASGK